MPAGVCESRRHLLQAAAWAPLFATAAPLQVLQGCVGRPAFGDELVQLGARDAVRRIRQGDMKAEAYAARLLKHHGQHKNLNTAISIDENRVLEQSRAVDLARSRGEPLGRLAGLPFMVKDTIDAIGYPTTAGTPALRGYMPRQNAPIVDAMLQSGAVLFAKANLQELGQGPTSSNPFFGFVRNPYDPARIPGGSSGGNGAALAARIVPAGLGADGGGSIRIPAAFCGVAGFRPTTAGARKRYSGAGQVPPAGPQSASTIGPMARTVADVALLDAAIMRGGVHELDSLRGVRIGIPRASFFWEDLEPGVAKVMDGVLHRLGEAGARLIDVDLREVIRLDNELKAVGAGASDDSFARFLQENVPGVTLGDLVAQIRSQDVKASREARMKSGSAPAASPDARMQLRTRLMHQYVQVFHATGIVALAFPTVPIAAPLIRPDGDVPGQRLELNGRSIPYIDVIARNTYFGSRQGAPGLSVPAGLTKAGLPVGLELDALQGDDGPLLGLGMAVESILGPLPPPTMKPSSIEG